MVEFGVRLCSPARAELEDIKIRITLEFIMYTLSLKHLIICGIIVNYAVRLEEKISFRKRHDQNIFVHHEICTPKYSISLPKQQVESPPPTPKTMPESRWAWPSRSTKTSQAQMYHNARSIKSEALHWSTTAEKMSKNVVGVKLPITQYQLHPNAW